MVNKNKFVGAGEDSQVRTIYAGRIRQSLFSRHLRGGVCDCIGSKKIELSAVADLTGGRYSYCKNCGCVSETFTGAAVNLADFFSRVLPEDEFLRLGREWMVCMERRLEGVFQFARCSQSAGELEAVRSVVLRISKLMEVEGGVK